MYLGVDLWAIISSKISNVVDKYGLFALCRDGRDVVKREVAHIFGFNAKQLHGFLSVVFCGRSLFLTGGAGVGKSFVVRRIADAVVQAHTSGKTQQGRRAVAIGAPTGAAARVASTTLVTGKTLHLLFNIRNRLRASNSAPYVIENAGGDLDGAEQLAVNFDHEDEQTEEVGGGGLPTAVLDTPTRERLTALKLLIVDECSMITREMMRLIDKSMRRARNVNHPFGGCCVLFVGDFYQLRPVVTTRDAYDRMGGKIWAFQSSSWRALRPLELTEVRRQAGQFPIVLNRVRVGAHTPADIQWLNTHARSLFMQSNATITIFNSNIRCNELNAIKLDRLPGVSTRLEVDRYCIEVMSYTPYMTRRLDDDEIGPSSPTFNNKGFMDPLVLKVGARVRCVKNTYIGNYPNRELVVANGQLGDVVSITPECIYVRWDPLDDEEPVVRAMYQAYYTRKQTFLSAGDHDIFAIARQFPLKLASAITIHASQGSTFGYPMNIDPDARSTRTPGGRDWGPMPAGAYVSISRATHIEKIGFLRPLRFEHIAADPDVRAYYQRTFGHP